jgi:hypothetical protein
MEAAGVVVETISTVAAEGELAGGWSWTVWLLIPAVLAIAYVTARVLGPDGAPPATRARRRAVRPADRGTER